MNDEGSVAHEWYGPGSTVEIVVPVFNEAVALDRSVRTLRSYLDRRFPFPTVVTIADNASTDATWEIAARLSAQLPGVRAVHLDRKGRGLALRAVWSASTADVVAYMDVDLSTDLDALLPLVAPLVSGHSDVAIGSRLARGAHVVRGPKREAISRAYNLIIRAAMRNRFTDAQCGFKAVRTDAVRRLLPLVEDDGWFFDTELLVLAEHNGMRIHEVPVDWVDDPDSRVDIVATALADLRGLVRVSRGIASGRRELPARSPGVPTQSPGLPARSPGLPTRSHGLPGTDASAELTARFVAIGGASTVAYLILFLVLQAGAGALAANAVALTACAGASALAHRRMLRRRSGTGRWRGAGAATVGAWAAALALASLALVVVGPTAPLVVDLVALVAANAVVSTGRFFVLRAVMFRHHLATLTAGAVPALPTTTGAEVAGADVTVGTHRASA
jgi:putative flippase GtrA